MCLHVVVFYPWALVVIPHALASPAQVVLVELLTCLHAASAKINL